MFPFCCMWQLYTSNLNQFNVVKIRFMNIMIAYTQGKVSLRKPKKSDYPL